MPVRYAQVSVPTFDGMVCDVCGKEDFEGCGTFAIDYTFGYGSPIDGENVKAAVCDVCLEHIIKSEIPNAQWNEGNS